LPRSDDVPAPRVAAEEDVRPDIKFDGAWHDESKFVIVVGDRHGEADVTATRGAPQVKRML
jgi:hypothetical protein